MHVNYKLVIKQYIITMGLDSGDVIKDGESCLRCERSVTIHSSTPVMLFTCHICYKINWNIACTLGNCFISGSKLEALLNCENKPWLKCLSVEMFELMAVAWHYSSLYVLQVAEESPATFVTPPSSTCWTNQEPYTWVTRGRFSVSDQTDLPVYDHLPRSRPPSSTLPK